jgi:hypothetical protein
MLKVVLGVAAFCGLATGLVASGGGGGCGGTGAGFCGFGDSGPIMVLPRVEEDVRVGGITLRLDREKWGYSIFADTSEGALARFFGEDIEVDLRRVSRWPVMSGRWIEISVLGMTLCTLVLLPRQAHCMG